MGVGQNRKSYFEGKNSLVETIEAVKDPDLKL